jgi:hypothetical protein
LIRLFFILEIYEIIPLKKGFSPAWRSI